MSVVCASSDYEQLEAICDRVLVFSHGRITCELTGDDIFKDRIMERCYLQAPAATGASYRGETGGGGMTEPNDLGPGDLLPDDAASGARKGGFSIGDVIERFALVIAWLVVIVVFSLLAPESYFAVRNFTTMFGTQTTLLMLSMGLLIPLTAGDYDLSVAGSLTMGGMIVAVLNTQHGVPIGWCILVALAAGLGIGLINGFFVMLFDIDPFIVTLGTGTVLYGLTYWMSDSQTVAGVSQWLIEWVVVKRIFGISLEFYYGLILTVVIWYFFEYTALGRRVLFVGRGRNVARLSGIRVGRVRWGCFIAAAVISAAAGVLYTRDRRCF